MKTYRVSIYLLAAFLLSASFGCASQRILNDKNPVLEQTAESTPFVPVDDFLEGLASVQTGNFEYVFAFRRKDGSIFTGEDKRYLKENSPYDTNQWVLTADEKAVIAGSNYVFTEKNLDALKKRFKIEEYSPEKEPGKENEKNSNILENTANSN